ncbi:hypothetical protein JCM1841_001286 [Sporobolomyces salmonicolor]
MRTPDCGFLRKWATLKLLSLLTCCNKNDLNSDQFAPATWDLGSTLDPRRLRLVRAPIELKPLSENNQGGNVVAVMITAIWPSFGRIKNTLPENLGITTQEMVGFLLSWLVQAPLACIPVYRLKTFFSIKAYISMIAFFALCVWTLVVPKGKGQITAGPMDSSKFP